MSDFANIFEFTDFRKFLAEYQERRKLAEPAFTKSEFCKQLGMPRTRSYLNDVLQGKSVTKEMQNRFEKVLGLSGKESKYFEAMIRFSQAQTGDARDKAFKEMIAINPEPKSIVDPDSYELFAHWYNIVLLHLCEIENIKDDLSELSEKIFPPVSKKNLEAAFGILQKKSLVRKNSSGFWKPTGDSFSTVQQCKDQMILQYQKQCLELSKEALESTGKESRDMTTFSFSVSESGKQKIDREVERFKNRIRQIVAADTEKSCDIEHINLHVFSHLPKQNNGENG